MTSIKEEIITAWITKISNKMREKASSYAEFICGKGKDFEFEELPWIEKTLIPALVVNGMSGSTRHFNEKGAVLSCDCWSEVCGHSTGRKFCVQLL